MDLLRILPVQYRFSRSRSQGPIRNPRLIVADSVLVPYLTSRDHPPPVTLV